MRHAAEFQFHIQMLDGRGDAALLVTSGNDDAEKGKGLWHLDHEAMHAA
jgi:hypothetical protein